MISARLSRALVDFSRTLVSEYVAESALADLMAVAAAELSVDGAGIMLADQDGELRFVAASDDRVRLIEQFQVETGEGPCVLAARTGQFVTTGDLSEGDERFPTFSKLASAAGLRSVHSFPMTVEATSIGAMNLYADRPGGLSDDEVEAGRVLADMASAYLFSARHADDATRMLTELRAAMDRNHPIEQAKGFVSAARDMTLDEALEIMRAHARSHNRRLLSVAQDVLDRRLSASRLRHRGRDDRG